jgi:DNA segregation ATPase FtsK/SpoIIIE-like protein
MMYVDRGMAAEDALKRLTQRAAAVGYALTLATKMPERSSALDVFLAADLPGRLGDTP